MVFSVGIDRVPGTHYSCSIVGLKGIEMDKIVAIVGQNFGPMKVEPNDLLLFAHVVDDGSFTKAALRLGLPKSTVSRRLAALGQQREEVAAAGVQSRGLFLQDSKIGERDFEEHLRLGADRSTGPYGHRLLGTSLGSLQASTSHHAR